MKIELDFPPSELFPNRAKGTHWIKLHHVRGHYRQTSAWLAKQQIKTWTHDGGDVHLKITFVMPDKRFRDLDNCLAASKAALDGLSDALMVNDKFFHPITVSREVGTRKTAKLIVEML